MRKKDLDILKTTNFLQNYPIILLIQHNNLTANNWIGLRASINNFPNCNILLFKNTIMKKAVNNFYQTSKRSHLDKMECIESIFQGPSFAIGCKQLSELKNLWNSFKSTPNIIILGGIYSNTVLTHLDIQKILNLNNNEVYNNFLISLENSNCLYNTLQLNKYIDVFHQTQLNLLKCLVYLKTKK